MPRSLLPVARDVFYGVAAPLMVAHAAVIASRAGQIAALLELDPAEQDVCEAFGLVHDIGKAPPARRTGFHPLDGAEYVEPRLGPRLAGLVAHHSGAGAEAELREIIVPFPPEPGDVAAIVDYCDLTTLPSGQPTSLEERRADIVSRHGADNPGPRSLETVWESVVAIEDRLRVRAGHADGARLGLAPGLSRASTPRLPG
jgi:hypothetical protein